ncbi:MAG: sigma factor-like helix-turn-helix DNA-binding protein [Peptoniphilaceae bacterium]|nr:helix-turn-helix domain-containing protein [Peptoniphilaceae bacterium]MDD7383786.1 sigma factor-like helix-turn-helix DNA-binding protein [Peptoniphilaceae bacterium]MDY3738114.1 sigma factor-like helix-turn-helix DNA-binding protein [Peptoniphilaceae bacterium]
MEKIIEIGILYSYYSSLLTAKQRDVVNGYFNEDLSLNEIAQLHGISKQSVSDMLNRSVKKLYNFENKLGIVKKSRKITDEIFEIIDLIKKDTDKNIIVEKLLRITKEN